MAALGAAICFLPCSCTAAEKFRCPVYGTGDVGYLALPGADLPGVRDGWVCSSAGEHRLHTAGVTGSIPVTPTILAGAYPMPDPLVLPAAIEIEGHAIVSGDGMISAADGSMPPTLHNDADWAHFQGALKRSALVVLGRPGHLRHPNIGRRPRLVFTSTVERFAVDPIDQMATFYNPAGASFAELLAHLGIIEGVIAVTGGTRVFDYFLPLYDRFDLAETNGITLPEGRPCFAGGHPRTALSSAGLAPAQFEFIDANAGVTLTRWMR